MYDGTQCHYRSPSSSFKGHAQPLPFSKHVVKLQRIDIGQEGMSVPSLH